MAFARTLRASLRQNLVQFLAGNNIVQVRSDLSPKDLGETANSLYSLIPHYPPTPP